MSFGLDYDAKEQVRQAIDLVDLMSSYLELRRQGRNYVALCPWHDDTRPSLQINPERQSWKCWVCDVGGDLFSFVMQREGIGFREALEMLADRAGIELRRASQPGTGPQPGSPGHKPTLYEAAAWAERLFHRYLQESSKAEQARLYLDNRGISDESIDRFRLGFTPDDFGWLTDQARATQFSPAVLEAIGLLAKSRDGRNTYDRFKGRVLFPIRDPQGRTIAFGGRILPGVTDRAKYINSPETRLFSKSDTLYGLDLARDAVAKKREIVVVEGYTDVVIANQYGLDDVVAVLGTALNARHIHLLRRFADRITLVLDGDEAGQRRTNELLELFVSQQMDLRILTLPEGMDPCDYVLEQGADALRQLQNSAVDALEHKLQLVTRGLDPQQDVHEANRALEEVLGTMAVAPRMHDGGSSEYRLREQQMLTRLARWFHVPEEELRQRMQEVRTSRSGRGPRPSGSSLRDPKGGYNKARPGGSEDRGEPSRAVKLHPMDAELLEILCVAPSLVVAAREQIPRERLHHDEARRIYDTFALTYEANSAVEFAHVLTELEEPHLKNLLVQLDEQASAKAAQAHEDAAMRLNGLSVRYRQVQSRLDRRRELDALQQRNFNETEELAVLQRLIQQERERQGISGPTDG